MRLTALARWGDVGEGKSPWFHCHLLGGVWGGVLGERGYRSQGARAAGKGLWTLSQKGPPDQFGPRRSAPWTEAGGAKHMVHRAGCGHSPGPSLPRPLWVPLQE